MSLENQQISRRVGIVSFFTVISRIAGFVRDAVLAYTFGASRVADAFYVAFRIPNLLRRLVGEGALTIAFVPVYTQYLHESRAKAKEVASVVFTYLSLLLTLIVVVGIVFAPWIVKIMAWGFSASPDKFELTVYLTRLLFPYLFCISLVALAMGILNSLKHFAAPAAAPILLNLSMIFGALVLWHYFSIPVVGLALGVLLGGVLQLALQIPVLYREGMLPRLNFNYRHPALRSLLLLMGPSAFGASVYQVNLLIITLIASFLPEGSVSFLWYADRVSEFSLGVFAIAIATATLPTLSKHAAKNDMQAFKDTMNYGLRLNFLITVPSAVGMYFLAEPIIQVLFERGEFSATSSLLTAWALAIFAFKIPFVAGVRNLAPGFYALKDAKTPVFISVATVAVNAVVAYCLMDSMLHLGLAAALVVSSIFNFIVLLYCFRRKVGLMGGKLLATSLGKTFFSSFVMAVFLKFSLEFVSFTQLPNLANKVGALFLLIAGGAFIYLLITRLINQQEYQAVKNMLFRAKKADLAG